MEPGIYTTDWARSSAVRAKPNVAYEAVREARDEEVRQLPADIVDNPAGVGPAILKVVDTEKPPLRVFFGKMPMLLVPPLYAERLRT